MGIPSDHPPHVSHHPETVLADVWRLVDEELLVALYPVIGVFRREMPAPCAQLTDEVFCVKALITLRV